MAFYVKCCQCSSTYKALHNPWSHFIFGLWWVSLAEYLLYLGFYSHYCRWYSLSWLLQELLMSHRGRGVSPTHTSLINPSHMLLWVWSWASIVFELWWQLFVSNFNLLLLLFYSNLVYNNLNSHSNEWTIFVNLI